MKCVIVGRNAALTRILNQQETMMAILDDLKAAADATVALLTKVHDELVAALAANNMPAIQAVIDELNAAIAANQDPVP